MKLSLILLAILFAACTAKTAIPTEFPTPPPAPFSTPLPKMELKPDIELQKKFEQISKDAKGKVGVAAVVLETGQSAMLNADGHFPMQSVYKLPISMAVMDQVRLVNSLSKSSSVWHLSSLTAQQVMFCFVFPVVPTKCSPT
jgi:beta-lactamase class A